MIKPIISYAKSDSELNCTGKSKIKASPNKSDLEAQTIALISEYLRHHPLSRKGLK